MKTFWKIILFMVSTAWMSGCSSETDPGEKNIILTEKAAKLVDVNNQFGLDLYREIYEYEKEAENLMVSPLSVALALAMTYNGAQTSTQEAMEKALRLKGLTREEINPHGF